MKKATIRITFDIILFTGVYFFSWWLVLFTAIAAFFVSSAPELIMVGVLLDVIYRGTFSFLPHFEFTFTVLFTLLFFSVEFLKRYIIIYDET